MIEFSKFRLNNGLRVVVHTDTSSPLVTLDVLYDVGARDEDPEKTGFAHLFEHLMFGGSVNVPDFDKPLQRVGATNNAFTTNDITNYYLTVPRDNLETGFWLESDRMLSLAFSERSLEVQRQVVVEEYKQRYLNQPYGDVWLLLRPLAYKKHPYRWPTIGKEIAHIEQAQLDDVRSFFKKHYAPCSAVLTLAGNVTEQEVRELCAKWFEPIPAGTPYVRNLVQEPVQTEYRELEVERNVPANALYMAFHMCGRTDDQYYATDLVSDVLSRGQSSRLTQHLVKEQQLFSELNAYVMGEMDPGMFVIDGKLANGISFAEAEEAIWHELARIQQKPVSNRELEKVKNKIESGLVFSEMSTEGKALALAVAELMGDAGRVNEEAQKYNKVTIGQLQEAAKAVLQRENCSVLRIKANAVG